MDNRRWCELTKEEKTERKQALKVAWFKGTHFKKDSKQDKLANLMKQQEKCLRYDQRSFC